MRRINALVQIHEKLPRMTLRSRPHKTAPILANGKRLPAEPSVRGWRSLKKSYGKKEGSVMLEASKELARNELRYVLDFQRRGRRRRPRGLAASTTASPHPL